MKVIVQPGGFQVSIQSDNRINVVTPFAGQSADITTYYNDYNLSSLNLAPSITAPATRNYYEGPANKGSFFYFEFDKATVENVEVDIPDFPTTTFTYILHYRNAVLSATNQKVAWCVQGAFYNNADLRVLDQAFGTAVQVNSPGGDTALVGPVLYSTDESGAVTPGGAWRASNYLKLRIYRNATDATNDTLDADAHLLGVTIKPVNS